MSRIGKQKIDIPEGVNVSVGEDRVLVKGPKGELQYSTPHDLHVSVSENRVSIERSSEERRIKALHGLWRSLIANAVEGVSRGFEKRLEMVGTGYRAKNDGGRLVLAIGFSHPVVVEPPEGMAFEVEEEKKIIVKGFDKQLVGQIAAQIRALKKPEPYKGKGIRYENEVVRRKPGKAAKTATPGGA